MTVSAIRKKLSQYIEHASDDKIRAIYSLVENDLDNTDYSAYSEEFKRELDRRKAALVTGVSKPVSAEESKKRIAHILNSSK
jgi:hypothetical protein